MYKVDVPYWVVMGKRKPKKFYLNLNTYRNAHFQQLNNAKEEYYDLIKGRLSGLPTFLQVALTYTLYTQSNQLCDTANICCIVDKFFCDSLVQMGKLSDDNYQIVKSVDFRFGGVDKNNPRVEVSIEPMGTDVGSTAATDQIGHDPKETTMQITLVQREIETALRNYVTSSVSVQQGKRIDIQLKATRGADGYQAIIDIVDENAGAASDSESLGGAENSETTANVTEGPKAEPEVTGEPTSEGTTTKKSSLFSGAKEPANA